MAHQAIRPFCIILGISFLVTGLFQNCSPVQFEQATLPSTKALGGIVDPAQLDPSQPSLVIDEEVAEVVSPDSPPVQEEISKLALKCLGDGEGRLLEGDAQLMNQALDRPERILVDKSLVVTRVKGELVLKGNNEGSLIRGIYQSSGTLIICDSQVGDILTFSGRIILVNSHLHRIQWVSGQVYLLNSSVGQINSIGAATITDLPVGIVKSDRLKIERAKVDIAGIIERSRDQSPSVLKASLEKICENMGKQPATLVQPRASLYNVQGRGVFKMSLAYHLSGFTGEHIILSGSEKRAQLHALTKGHGKILVCNTDIDTVEHASGDYIFVNSKIGRLVNSNANVLLVGSQVLRQSAFSGELTQK